MRGLLNEGDSVPLLYAAEPRKAAWETARAQGAVEVVENVTQLAPYDLDLIVDFAGFGDTTAGAISAVRKGGLVVQVGLGRTQATISTAELVGKSVTLGTVVRKKSFYQRANQRNIRAGSSSF